MLRKIVTVDDLENDLPYHNFSREGLKQVLEYYEDLDDINYEDVDINSEWNEDDTTYMITDLYMEYILDLIPLEVKVDSLRDYDVNESILEVYDESEINEFIYNLDSIIDIFGYAYLEDKLQEFLSDNTIWYQLDNGNYLYQEFNRSY